MIRLIMKLIFGSSGYSQFRKRAMKNRSVKFQRVKKSRLKLLLFLRSSLTVKVLLLTSLSVILPAQKVSPLKLRLRRTRLRCGLALLRLMSNRKTLLVVLTLVVLRLFLSVRKKKRRKRRFVFKWLQNRLGSTRRVSPRFQKLAVTRTRNQLLRRSSLSAVALTRVSPFLFK